MKQQQPVEFLGLDAVLKAGPHKNLKKKKKGDSTAAQKLIFSKITPGSGFTLYNL